jgi:hypothetical protein
VSNLRFRVIDAAFSRGPGGKATTKVLEMGAVTFRPTLAALLFVVSCVASRSDTTSEKEPAKVLPFIEDDYPQALALARERKLPLFVDSWAPW